jgi:dihydroxyacid dehydratase/phosphogluconate dehydratase
MYLAGGVPEVQLHLRNLGLLDLDALTINGNRLGDNLEIWENSDRRAALKERLLEMDGIHASDVISDPNGARAKGLTSTVCFPMGNIAPEGSVIKATSIDAKRVDADGTFRHTGRAKVYTSEKDAIAAVKGQSDRNVEAGDIIVLICRGPMGSGMEETYQITSALKHTPWGNQVSLITDARFSGVSTGACIGHVGPEALAGGPIGKLRDGDWLRITVDRVNLDASVDFLGSGDAPGSLEDASNELDARPVRSDLSADPNLPDDTRLWAALQNASGGLWGGCVYDTDAIIAKLNS